MPKQRSQAQGFTLLEIMLVVLIIGMITSLAVYAMTPMGPSRQAKSEAQSLMARLDYAQQQAIISHQPYGLVIHPHGYQFYVYQGQWQASTGKGFKAQELRSQLQLITPKPNVNASPSILLIPSKEPQVYELLFSLEGYNWHLRSNPPQAISLTAGAHE